MHIRGIHFLLKIIRAIVRESMGCSHGVCFPKAAFLSAYKCHGITFEILERPKQSVTTPKRTFACFA